MDELSIFWSSEGRYYKSYHNDKMCSGCWMLLTHKVKTTTHVELETRFVQYLFIDD